MSSVESNPFVMCNITKACHPCPDDAIRDEADYCVPTGWRQMITCFKHGTSSKDTMFQSCGALNAHTTSSSMAVAKFEGAMVLILVAACLW
eukprot:CAMPEP_0113722560 /NCGR_PEP_ID=MMETSP0038_2-20120614/37828_1 /TAXON_ID=2898 /ORGANISM="Cryptomonas paramecium" /LENGTH=90 /DNA_ID=CAMNT_0000651837 /DNA_START=132 /DNA_END=401 /DNA_ORIENTATION=+ /assembly_acc=CAM_ASM_000170